MFYKKIFYAKVSWELAICTIAAFIGAIAGPTAAATTALTCGDWSTAFSTCTKKIAQIPLKCMYASLFYAELYTDSGADFHAKQ